jgi:hypothetical protein
MTEPHPPLPQQIYMIRHGEKPTRSLLGLLRIRRAGRQLGVDVNGSHNSHSLVPRGWQRAGALAAVFAPAAASSAGLRTPTALYAPSYGGVRDTTDHRTFQTIQVLSERIGVSIRSPLPLGKESAVAAAVLAGGDDVVMLCWEHKRLLDIARALPAVESTIIPAAWPDDRFDVVWTFALDAAAGRYVFGQIPQRLLRGDADTVI